MSTSPVGEGEGDATAVGGVGPGMGGIGPGVEDGVAGGNPNRD